MISDKQDYDAESLPYRELFRAVIEQAFEDLEYKIKFNSPKKLTSKVLLSRIAKIKNEARISSGAMFWIARKDFTDLFSFENICDYLACNPDGLREAARDIYKNGSIYDAELKKAEGLLEKISVREEGGV